MNVKIVNKYATLLAALDVDFIKSIEGEFTPEDITNQFQSFFYNKMIIDITAIKDYQDITKIQELSINMDMSKVIFLLDDSEIVNSPRYLSQLVSMGIYNFTRNVDAIRFLIDNPTETVVISIRNLNENAGTLVTLLKELIDKQTFNLRDGDKTTVNLKDFVYTGNTFPKLKDVRKKMVIFSRISSLDIGIPMYSSNAYTSLLTNGAVVDGVSMYTENKEFQYTAEEKVNITTNSLDTVTVKSINTSGTKGKNGALIYTEGYKVDNTNTSAIVKVKPSEVATEVNKAIKAYDIPQGKLVGTIMVDFADEAMAAKILKTNP